MTDFILKLVDDWGIWGVLLSMVIEGSSFPFIGTFFIITVGFLLELSWFEISWISLFGSVLYAIGSYIPYFIGLKLGNSLENRLGPKRRESLEKAKLSFSKYGFWSVAISSPLHLGNVVPFLAGMSNMHLGLYTILTMIGIAPTTFLFLSIGHFYHGNTDLIIKKINQYQTAALFVFGFIFILLIAYKTIRTRNQKKNESRTFH